MVQSLAGVERTMGARLVEALVCFVVLLLAAAASFNGFYDKWGFRDGVYRFSAEKMFAGDAQRPFVYRQLNVRIADTLAEATPDRLKPSLQRVLTVKTGESRMGPDRVLTADPDWFLKYTALYYLTFLQWLIALLVMTALCMRYSSAYAAVSAVVVFALLFPVLLSQGGFFYDFPEIMFFAIAAYVASRGWLPLLAISALLAVFNKETIVFFLPTLLAFLLPRYGFWKSTLILGGLSIATAATYLWIAHNYADNPGGSVEFHLFRNIRFYGNPLNLFAIEETYGLPLFRAYSIVGVAFLCLVGIAGWIAAPKIIRLHVLLALLVNLPLFAVLAYRAELRNLSLTFVGWTIMLACAIEAWTSRSQTPRNRAPGRVL